MPVYSLQNHNPANGPWKGSRIRWLRWTQNVVSLIALFAFLSGAVLALTRWTHQRHALLLLGMGFVGIVVYFLTIWLDWCLFGNAIRHQFERAVATVRNRENYTFKPPRMGQGRPPRIKHAVRLRGAVNHEAGVREVEIVASLTVGWDTEEKRDQALASRIRPDGTCDVALDPEQPDRAYLLPWS